MLEQSTDHPQVLLPAVVETFGGRSRIGPVEIRPDIPFERDLLPNGEYSVLSDVETNTGHLLKIDGRSEPFAVKTFLKPKHSYLDFRELWKRLWSLAAEFQTVSGAQREWPEAERTHLGLVGIQDQQDGKVEFAQLSLEEQSGLEPALVMRWLPQENNLFHLMFRDPEHFYRLLPSSVRAIRDAQVGLGRDDALRYGGAEAVFNWIDKGNLNNLRKSPHQEDRELADEFWSEFSSFVLRYQDAIDGRARTSGAIVRGNGDTKPLNAFRVNERVAFIDPITLLLRTGEGRDDYAFAPWSLHDRVAELGYFTVYLKALESTAEQQHGVTHPRMAQMKDFRWLSLRHYETHYGEDPSRGKLSALHLMYEAGYASVEYELVQRDPQILGAHNGLGSAEAVAQGLKDVMMASLREAKRVAQENQMEQGW